MLKIQFFTAEPSDACKLKLAEEHDLIIDKLARHSKRFQFFSRMATTPNDIPEAILDNNPQIVHFSGHGSTKGEICVRDDNGYSIPIPVRALDRLFKLVSGRINCVILNACYSSIQAETISEHIDFVIGMNNKISDRAAIAFSEGFYRAYASGETIENAFEFGLLQLDLFDLPENNIPVLLTKNKNEKKEAEQDSFTDIVLRENILLILNETKLEVRGHQTFGLGGIGYGTKLYDEDIDDALIKLKKFDKEVQVTKILADIIGDADEDIKNAWKAIILLKLLQSPAGLEKSKVLFRRSSKVSMDNGYLHQNCLDYLDIITDPSLRNLKKEVLAFASLNCPTEAVKNKCIAHLGNLSKLNDKEVIETLIKIVTEDNSFATRLAASRELSKFRLHRFELPIIDWLSESNAHFRTNIAQNFALKYPEKLDFDEIEDIFYSEVDINQRNLLGQVLYKIDREEGVRLIISLLQNDDEEESLIGVRLVNILKVMEAMEEIKKLSQKSSIPQNIKQEVDRCLTQLEKLK
jgi:hypothetical protein